MKKDPTRNKFLLTGRRGGKTTYLCEDILSSIPSCPDRGELFYIGPTNQMASELMWEALEDRLDDLGWKYVARISKQRFEFSRGRKVYLIGAEKIRRIRGHKVYRLYLDELAFFETDLATVWKAARPTLTDLGGRVIASTTPNGKGTQAYDFYMECLTKNDWKCFSWNTLDNPFIDPDEIAQAKRDMDEKSFRQEYMASWESFEGLAYYNFDEKIHIKPSQLNPDLPIALCYDFNVNPTTILVMQLDHGTACVRKEFSFKNSSTIETTEAACLWLKQQMPDHLFSVDIHGDAAGNNRQSSTGRSDYHFVEEILKKHGINFKFKVMSKNPHPPDRLAYVNAWLKNVLGQSRIEIDPMAKELIRDLSSQELDGRYPSDKNNLGHKADAFGYFICWQQLVGCRVSTQIQL